MTLNLEIVTKAYVLFSIVAGIVLICISLYAVKKRKTVLLSVLTDITAVSGLLVIFPFFILKLPYIVFIAGIFISLFAVLCEYLKTVVDKALACEKEVEQLKEVE